MTHSLRSVELYLVRLPLVRPFTTSSHTKDHLDHILIRVRAASGAEGWGECASASDPYYCSETSETSWHILRDFLIPGVLGRRWDHPDEAAEALRQGQALDPNLHSVEAIIQAARTSEPVRQMLAKILTPRHPSQLYEALLEGLFLFVLLMAVRMKVRKPDGLVTGLFFVGYAVVRIFAEAFREPDAPLTGSLSRGQFLSLFMILVGIGFWVHAYLQVRRARPAPQRTSQG